jgi:hypothetical protein
MVEGRVAACRPASAISPGLPANRFEEIFEASPPSRGVASVEKPDDDGEASFTALGSVSRRQAMLCSDSRVIIRLNAHSVNPKNALSIAGIGSAHSRP